MRAKEIMTEDVSCCTPDTSLTQVAKMMKEEDCGSVPIVEDMDNRKVIGIVTDRDITCKALANGQDPSKMKVEDCMTRGIVTATPEMDMNEVCKIMEKKQVRRLPVVGDDSRLLGIISQADIALRMGQNEAGEVVRYVSEHRA